MRIADNGRGYLPTDTITMGGGKRADKEAAGQFGTGMKVSDQSALEQIGPNGERMKVARCSRNWRSEAHLYKDTISAGHVTKLGYRVWFYEDCIPGSVVEYRNPSKDILDAARKIKEYYLPLDNTLEDRLLAHNQYGLILDPKNGNSMVTVNGRHYEFTVPVESPFLFSYDLHDCTITDQNRHFIDTSSAIDNIRNMLASLQRKEIILKLFKTSNVEDVTYYEHQMRGVTPTKAFPDAAKEYFNIPDFNRVYVDYETDGETKKILERKGLRAISVGDSVFLRETLENINVLTGNKIRAQIEKKNELSTTEAAEYEKGNLATCAARAVETAESLRGDNDVEITVLVEYKGTERRVKFADFVKENKYKKAGIKEFFVGLPEVMPEEGVQDKVETLLVAACAAGIECYVYNGTDEFQVIGERKNRWSPLAPWMCRRQWTWLPQEKFQIHMPITSSAAEENLRELHKYSLRFNPDYKPVDTTVAGDVVSLERGQIYEQGVLKQGISDKSAMILSYNFPFKVGGGARDSRISRVISAVKNKDVAVAILKFAKENKSDQVFPEYEFRSGNKQIWVEAFEEVFGEDTVVDDFGTNDTTRSYAKSIASSSAIKVVKIMSLRLSLGICGVKRLSLAVQPDRILRYEPTPSEKILLMLGRLTDESIKRSLPRHLRQIDSNVIVVDDIKNCYGMSIKEDDFFLHPFEEFPSEIYVFRSLLRKKEASRLFMVIANGKTEAYRRGMSQEEFAGFKWKVMDNITKVIDLDFLKQYNALCKRDASEAEVVIERKVAQMDFPIEEEQVSRKRVMTIEDMNERRATRRKIRNIIAGVAAAIGLALGGVAIMENVNFKPDTTRKILEREGGKKGFNRPRMNLEQMGVDIDRGIRYGRDDEEAAMNSRDGGGEAKQFRSFITVPKLAKHDYMRESLGNVYNGTGWDQKENAPEFEQPNHTDNQKYLHWQRINPGQKTAILRTRAGGEIDPRSIELVKIDGSVIHDFLAARVNNGEYEITVQVDDDDIEAVRYTTKSPLRWIYVAKQLTNEDYQKLDQHTLGLYTMTPNLDLSRIRLQSERFKQFSNLQDFFDSLQGLKPYERITHIRSLVRGMRYTRTQKTERAFQKFYGGQVPEKDILEFLFNSPELEYQGDGDCDVQNSIFALLCRYAGIPSRISAVITDNGVGHGVAEVFIPKVGWVMMDTMGETIIEETVIQHRDGQVNPPREITAQEIEEAKLRALNKELHRQLELEKRGCTELLE